MDEFDKLLLGKAGIKLPNLDAPLPPNKNNGKLLDIDVGLPTNKNTSKLHDEPAPRGGNSGHNTDISTTRSGSDGHHNDISTTRSGSDGHHNDIDTSRSGEDGRTTNIDYNNHQPTDNTKLSDPVVSRSGTPGRDTDINTPRSGANGTTSDINAKRSGKDGSTELISIDRGGSAGSYKDIESPRPGLLGEVTDIEVPRSGTPGSFIDLRTYRKEKVNTDVDVNVTRGGTSGNDNDVTTSRPANINGPTDMDKAEVPTDTNLNSRSSKNPKFTNDLLSLDMNLRSLSNFTGIPFANATQAKYWIKKLTGVLGNDELESIMGFTPNNEDIVSYYQHMMINPWNLARIPLDLAMRLLVIPGKLELTRITRKFTNDISKARLINTENNINHEYLMMATNQNYLQKHSGAGTDDNNDTVKGKDGKLYSNLGKYFGYEFTDDQIIETTRLINKVMTRSGFYDHDATHFAKDYQPGNKSENYYPGNRDLWVGANGMTYEMADNAYWGVKVMPYTGHTNLLPAFPKEFSHGWWPVTGCGYTKNSLSSKGFSVPFYNLEVPISAERPSKLTLNVVDNARHAIRYWLEDYVRGCFSIDKNLVLPYKNICFDITVYRYDCNFSVLYQARYICLLASHNLSFSGDGSHGTDDIDLSFEIVGDYPGSNKSVKAPKTVSGNSR